jgi:CheY-like chemotaxis protein
VNVNDVISDFEKLLRKIVDKDILFEIKLTKKLHAISGDENQIEQIVMNLVVNARDAIRERGTTKDQKRITLETMNVGPSFENIHGHPYERDGITIGVSDTGAGIPPELQKKIFEPLFTTKGKDRGTGLGLSTVTSIVEDYKGKVYLSSEVGKGSSFTIFIPATAEHHPESKTPAAAEPAQEVKKHVAVIEDSPDTLFILKKYLENAGFIVHPFQSEASFNVWLEEPANTVDLVITDFYLIESTGSTVIEGVRKYHPDLPVILVSGYPLEKLNIDLVAYTNVEFVQKPYSAAKIVESVKKLLGLPIAKK